MLNILRFTVINFKIFRNMNSYRTCFLKTLIALSVSVMFFASCKEDEEVSRSTACDILTFKIGETAWNIDGTNITRVYPSAILPTPLTPTITVSPGATVSPLSGQEQDNFFREGGITYTVTAEDRVTTKTYTARAIRTPYSGCEILSFTAGGVEWEINDSLITYSFPSKTQETPFAPMINLSVGAKVYPVATEARNFFTQGGVKYTVTAEDGISKKTYTVKARRQSTACDITSFLVNDTPWDISGTNISYVFHEETDGVRHTPVITVSQGATVDPPSGEAQDFFAGVTYTVTAEDTTITKTYTVKARTVSSECSIVSFRAGNAEWTVNEEERRITYSFPVGTSQSRLSPAISLSPGATVNPPEEQLQDFFTANGVQYTVTAEDGIATKTYTAKAIVMIRHDVSDWLVLPRHGSHSWNDGVGTQTLWPGGNPMLILDDDPESGWHSPASWSALLPQMLIIDMKESKQIVKVLGNGNDLKTVQLYLTDDLSIPGYERHEINWSLNAESRNNYYNTWVNTMNGGIPASLPISSWGASIAETDANATQSFSFTLESAESGRFLILLFPESAAWAEDWPNTYIAIFNLEVYGY
jgi:hypothetical protein